MRKGTRGSDALLKLLIQGAGAEPFRQLLVDRVKEWLNVDLPKTQSPRLDLVGRTAAGKLLHIELQSTNDPLMALRMAEYALAILRKYGTYPEQLLLYVGNDRLRMSPELREQKLQFEYRQIDIRQLDGESLLASDEIADNILGVMAGLHDPSAGIRTILRRIVRLSQCRQEGIWQQLLLTCEIRGLESVAQKEVKYMPVTFEFDLMKYDFIADAVRKGREEGREEGKLEANRELVRGQLEKRFGRLPKSVIKRIGNLSASEVHELALAVLDAKSLKDLFNGRPAGVRKSKTL